jgi:hypothetical protein
MCEMLFGTNLNKKGEIFCVSLTTRLRRYSVDYLNYFLRLSMSAGSGRGSLSTCAKIFNFQPFSAIFSHFF